MKNNGYREEAGLTRTRSHVYRLLELCFAREPNEKLVGLFYAPEFEDLAGVLGIAFRGDAESSCMEDLVIEFTRLFLGPGPHISPYESVHREDEEKPGLYWGDSTVRLKRLVESMGLEFGKASRGIPDHISVELELMRRLTSKEAEAWEEGLFDRAILCLEYEERVLVDHLTRWVPTFCEKVIAGSRFPFFADLAEFTRTYIENDLEHTERLLERIHSTGA